MHAGEGEWDGGHFLGALDGQGDYIGDCPPAVEQGLKALLFVVSESGKGGKIWGSGKNGRVSRPSSKPFSI